MRIGAFVAAKHDLQKDQQRQDTGDRLDDQVEEDLARARRQYKRPHSSESESSQDETSTSSEEDRAALRRVRITTQAGSGSSVDVVTCDEHEPGQKAPGPQVRRRGSHHSGVIPKGLLPQHHPSNEDEDEDSDDDDHEERDGAEPAQSSNSQPFLPDRTISGDIQSIIGNSCRSLAENLPIMGESASSKARFTSFICWRLQNIRRQYEDPTSTRRALRLQRLDALVAVIIVLQAIALGAEVDIDSHAKQTGTSIAASTDVAFFVLQVIFTVVFLVEFFIRTFFRMKDRGCRGAFGLGVSGICDCAMCGVSVLDVVTSALNQDWIWVDLAQTMRLFRLTYLLPSLWSLVRGTAGAVRVASQTILLIMVLCWSAALLCAQYYLSETDNGIAEVCNADGELCMKDLFGSLGDAFITHVKLLLMEAWPDFAEPMLADSRLWIIYIVAFLCIANIGLLNVVVSVVCQQINSWTQAQQKCTYEEFLSQCREMDREMTELFVTATQGDETRIITEEQYLNLLKSRPVADFLQRSQVNLPLEPDQLVRILDKEGKGTISISDWKEGLSRLRGTRSDHLSQTLQYTLRELHLQMETNITKAQTSIRKTMKEAIMEAGLRFSEGLDRAATLIPTASRNSIATVGTTASSTAPDPDVASSPQNSVSNIEEGRSSSSSKRPSCMDNCPDAPLPDQVLLAAVADANPSQRSSTMNEVEAKQAAEEDNLYDDEDDDGDGDDDNDEDNSDNEESSDELLSELLAPSSSKGPSQVDLACFDLEQSLQVLRKTLEMVRLDDPMAPPVMKDHCIQTDEYAPFEEGFGTERTFAPPPVLPCRCGSKGGGGGANQEDDVLRASGFAMSPWAAELLKSLKEEDEAESGEGKMEGKEEAAALDLAMDPGAADTAGLSVRTARGSNRNEEDHEGFLLRLRRGELHEDDIQRLVRAGNGRHADEVGLSRRFRIFSSPQSLGGSSQTLMGSSFRRRSTSPLTSPSATLRIEANSKSVTAAAATPAVAMPSLAGTTMRGTPGGRTASSTVVSPPRTMAAGAGRSPLTTTTARRSGASPWSRLNRFSGAGYTPFRGE